MAQLGTKFKATEHDTEQREYENIPDGIYRLEATKADVAATSKGDGTILKIQYGVIEPEQYKGRIIFGNITLENPNAQAQEIGQRQLASLCRAIGLSEVEDSDELLFQAFVAKVGLSKERKVGDKVYSPRNEVKRFYFPDSDDMPEVGITGPVAANDNRKTANDNKPAPEQKQAASGAAGKKRPWGK
jgi:hypothetical protein